MSDSEDLVEMPEDGDDLFGESDNGDALPGSDREAGSDNEAADRTRAFEEDDDDQPQAFHEDRVIESVEVHRHRIPKPKDGMLRALRVPKFMRILPEVYDRETFEPTEEDVENARSENPKAAVRMRKDPATGKFQSNTMIHRWSDGSVTMSVGDEHFDVSTKSLAPALDKPYQELQDGHYYAAAVDLNSNHYMMVGHIHEQFIVRPGKNVEDDALAKLAERMQAASRGAHDGDMIIKTMQDPEQRKREAEQAEKERNKAQRRRETQAAKMDGAQRYPRGAGGGLSINDLEGGRRGAGSRKRGAAGAGKPKRRRPEYDSDDDLPDGARRAGDDYDLGDDFIAPSDEEGSEGEEDEEEEEEEERPRKKRQRTVEPDDDDDDDAEGELDDDEVAGGRARQRRHVIDDDDDED